MRDYRYCRSCNTRIPNVAGASLYCENHAARPFRSIDDIRAANDDANLHYFEASTMRFFNSRILSDAWTVPGGALFVTSERYDWNSPRRYSVRIATADGHIESVGEFQEHATAYRAKRAAKAHAATLNAAK